MWYTLPTKEGKNIFKIIFSAFFFAFEDTSGIRQFLNFLMQLIRPRYNTTAYACAASSN